MIVSLCLVLASAGTVFAVTGSCPEEWAYFQDHCYRVPVGKFSFARAFEVCQNMSSHPIVITSDDEQNYAEDIFFRAVGRNLWTAGIRVAPGSSDSSFRWMTGQALTYSRWARNQPDNYDRSEYCVLLSSGPLDTGSWHDVRCEQKHAVLCQRTVNESRMAPEFGDIVKDLYRKYHPVPQSDFRFYSPFLMTLGVIASMFTVMLVVFFVLTQFLESTRLDADVPVSVNNNDPKAGKNGVLNNAYFSA